MPIIATVPAPAPGHPLAADATVTIDGREFPIPNQQVGGYPLYGDGRRIIEALRVAGYRKVGVFTERDGVVEFPVEPTN